MAFGRKNTRKNLDDKKTTPVLDPKMLLKPKGYLKQTTASTCKVYQPKVTQVNDKVQTKELTLNKILNKFILQRHQLVNLRLNSKIQR
jgi:hypothetical protein